MSIEQMGSRAEKDPLIKKAIEAVAGAMGRLPDALIEQFEEKK